MLAFLMALVILNLLAPNRNLVYCFRRSRLSWVNTAMSTMSTSLNHHKETKALRIGLTGSIGMGKSTVSGHFKNMGFLIFDADAAVHQLYGVNGAAVGPISSVYPDAVIDGAVSRPVLAKKVMENSTVLRVLEDIVHPLVAAERRKFYEAANRDGHFMVIYDIPLLLEKPGHEDVDYVVVATASAATQKTRVMERPGMTEEKFESLLAKQMPDAEKRTKADYLVHTDYPGLAQARAQVAKVVEDLIAKHPDRWESWKRRGQRRRSAVGDLNSCEEGQQSAGGNTVAASTNNRVSPMRDAFDLVVFDLDDTLVPVWDPIVPATEALMTFLKEKMPKTAAEATRDRMRDVMRRLSTEQPLIAHDLTELRKEALTILSTPHNEQSLVDEAVKVFVTARSHVAPHLYDDVLPCLQWLKEEMGMDIAVVTNGNAEGLHLCDTLGKYVSLSISATDVGVMKPSPVPFLAVSQRTGVTPDRILFVGDSHDKDVLGAQATGMVGVLIARRFDDNANGPSSTADNAGSIGTSTDTTAVQIRELMNDDKQIVLSTLMPTEFQQKVERYLAKRHDS